MTDEQVEMILYNLRRMVVLLEALNETLGEPN